jgi:hypothetical protein
MNQELNESNNYGVEVEYLAEPPSVIYVDFLAVEPKIAKAVPILDVEEDDYDWACDTDKFLNSKKVHRQRYDDWSYADLHFA